MGETTLTGIWPDYNKFGVIVINFGRWSSEICSEMGLKYQKVETPCCSPNGLHYKPVIVTDRSDGQNSKNKIMVVQMKKLDSNTTLRTPVICLNAALWAACVGFLCGCQWDASHIAAEPCIYRRKISEEVTDMPQVLSFIGWLLGGLSFIGWLLRQAYLYWLAPPEDSL